VCYEVLAELCLENGDNAGALKYWHSGQAWATSLDNADYIAICSVGLADIYEHEHKYDLAGKELERAITYDRDPQGQATLLIKSMRVHLLSGDDQRAQQIFHQVRTLCMKHNFFDCMVDAHVIASSFEWDKHDRASRVSALVGYMIAVTRSIVRQPLESTVAVQIYIIRKLANPNHPFDLIDYESMLEEAQNSLLQMIPTAKKMLLRVLWPFDVIRKVLPFVGDESRLSTELQRAMRSAQSSLRSHAIRD
jgi:tetratricopeptide (TPR) repeat protein